MFKQFWERRLNRLRRTATAAGSPRLRTTAASRLSDPELLGSVPVPAAAPLSEREFADWQHRTLQSLAADARVVTVKDEDPVESSLATGDPERWRALENEVSHALRIYRVPPYVSLDWLTPGPADFSGLLMASFHSSGFVREAAVELLAKEDSPVTLNALVLRAGDRVPQVRDHARHLLGPRVDSADVVLAIGPLAVAVQDRRHGRWMTDLIEQWISTCSGADLDRLRASADRGFRRLVHLLAIADRRLDLDHLMWAAQHDGDQLIRSRCSEAAIVRASSAADLARVRPLLNNGAASIRALAISKFARAGDSAVVTAGLVDRSAAVREVAQILVRRIGADPAALYREMVPGRGYLAPGSVAGLGETGSLADEALLRPALRHPLVRGRVEAVRAMRRLGIIEVDTLLGMLHDPSAAVVRQVGRSLRLVADDVPESELRRLLAADMPLSAREVAHRVLRTRDPVTRVETALELYADQDAAIRARAREDLDRWLRHDAATSYPALSPATAARLEKQIAERAAELGPERCRLLRFHLSLAG